MSSKLRYITHYGGSSYRGAQAYTILRDLWLSYVSKTVPVGPKVRVMREMATKIAATGMKKVAVKIWREPRKNRASQSRYVLELTARAITPGPLRQRRPRTAAAEVGPTATGGRRGVAQVPRRTLQQVLVEQQATMPRFTVAQTPAEPGNQYGGNQWIPQPQQGELPPVEYRIEYGAARTGRVAYDLETAPQVPQQAAQTGVAVFERPIGWRTGQ